ncbi:MAG: flagellar basal body L-ring protein FlgH [Chitinivibrionales bacterium]|nr:flagellar basal body L-ring protein FlgH [Chitinivibrionales bacterium]
MRTKRIIAFVISVGLLSTTALCSDVYNLYTDHRAMRMDDILTVFIVENAKAGSQSTTQSGKKNSVGIDNLKGSGALHLIPSFGASGQTSVAYDGKGVTSREGNLVAKISVRVVKVLDNGNLVINGQKVVEINEEKETITISGVVRPQDIESDNTIYSHSLSDAKITYCGSGTTTRGQRPGFFARLFNWIL